MHPTATPPPVVPGRQPLRGPDIITLTDVIATLTRSNGDQNKEKIDAVFREAVERKLILQDHLDRFAEVDLSGMSLPVARAACRFVIYGVQREAQRGKPIERVSFITGVGKAQLPRKGAQPAGPDESAEGGAGLSLREHIQDILRSDFDPPIESVVPTLAQGTVEVSKDVCSLWGKA